MTVPDPFAYPQQPHQRVHGPDGYSSHGEYREWLRDDWDFRCPYCLRREKWATFRRDWNIDHFEPIKYKPDLETAYDNLIWACANCNQCKGIKSIPDPSKTAYSKLLQVDDEGKISYKGPDGEKIIDFLQLDDEWHDAARRFIRNAIRVARKLPEDDEDRRQMLADCLGWPSDLPDLVALADRHPPKSNTRPEGMINSHYEQKRRGALPVYY